MKQIMDVENLDQIIESYANRGKKKSVDNRFRYKMERGGKVVTINPSDFVGVVANTHRINLGKTYALVACTKGDGNCPICAKYNEAWKMVNKLAEETAIDVSEDQKEIAMNKVRKEQIEIVHNRAFEKPTTYIYFATARLKNVVLKGKEFTVKETVDYKFEDGTTETLPAFEIKIKRVTSNAFKGLQEDFRNDAVEFNGGVLLTMYPETEDVLSLGRDKKIKVVDKDIITEKYPRLQDAIDVEVRKVFKAVEVDGVLQYDFNDFKTTYLELDSSRLDAIDIDGIANNVLGVWYNYQEYIKTNPEVTFSSFKENKGIKVETPVVSLDADKDNSNSAIASASAVNEDDDLPF